MNIFISVAVIAVSFLSSAIIGRFLIPFLHKLKYGQTILDIGPNWHKNKEGTPTMGGIMFILGTTLGVILAIILTAIFNKELLGVQGHSDNVIAFKKLLAGLIMAIGFGFVGFIDDYIKVVKKRNLGLSPMGKIVMQIVIIAAYFASLRLFGDASTDIVFPFIGTWNCPWWLYYPAMAVFIIYVVNAVNLTDGVDGLCASCTVVYCAAFMVISTFLGFVWQNIYAAALAGALVGFLIWNIHPAKTFMGDTGSMFLGGSVVALGFGVNLPILIIIVGILYILDALSVVIQVCYFKATKGKRLFKMSPIHHHFEMSGWSENKIVLVFSLVTLIGGILGCLCLFGINK